MTLRLRPELFALLAAMANGTIGPLNRFGFAEGATHHQIAFFKCFGAFLIVLVICLLKSQMRKQLFLLRARVWSFALLAFLGVFCLYFFETWAFSEASIPLVSFLTYAAGGGTIVLSAVFLREKINITKLISFCIILGGVWLLYAYEGNVTGSHLGVILALVGGLGYALFIFLAKFLNIGGGLPHLAWLFGFGSIYLLLPWGYDGFVAPPISSIWPVMGLIILPTIGGFWLTTKAVQGGSASGVQIIETSDPLFASLFAYILFGEALGEAGITGASLIFIGLLLALYKSSYQIVGETD